MMRSFIAVCKVVCVIAATLLIYSGYIVGYFILRIFSRPSTEWLNRILRFWGRSAAFFLSIDVNVEGKKPEPPFFLVCNHLSYVDIIVLFSELNSTFVAKSEVANWPILGLIARSIGIVFIDRKNRMDIARVNKEISTTVSSKRGLTLFPEGTTSPGENVLRFRAPLLEYPAKSQLGVHCCALYYDIDSDKRSAHEIVCWWGDAPLHKHLFRLAKEKRIHATISFGDNTFHDNNRKKLADTLHEVVNNLFTPMCKSGSTEFEPLTF